MFSEVPPFSIEALRAEMDDLLAWTDQLRVELDTRAAHQYLQVERLESANRELSVQFDLLPFHTIFITFYLIFLIGHFGYQGQVGLFSCSETRILRSTEEVLSTGKSPVLQTPPCTCG